MSFTIGVLKETAADETRVAITPEIAKKLTQLNVVIIMEKEQGHSLIFSMKNMKG